MANCKYIGKIKNCAGCSLYWQTEQVTQGFRNCGCYADRLKNEKVKSFICNHISTKWKRKLKRIIIKHDMNEFLRTSRIKNENRRKGLAISWHLIKMILN